MKQEDFDISKIIESIKSDFATLWNGDKRGNTIVLNTPFSLPDGDLVQLGLTTRDDRYVVTDLAYVSGLDFSKDHRLSDDLLEDFKVKFNDGFSYKDCVESRLISSLVYDMSVFCYTAAILIAYKIDPE